jgi:hypothetical protein
MVYSCIRILAEKEGGAYAGFSQSISATQQKPKEARGDHRCLLDNDDQDARFTRALCD